jgi:hypothetical protein
MQIQVKDASGDVLDYLIAVCHGRPRDAEPLYHLVSTEGEGGKVSHHVRCIEHEGPFRPSTDLAVGFAIVDREIDTLSRRSGYFYAQRFARYLGRGFDKESERWAHGPNMVVAGLRCLALAKLGDVVDVPDVLVQSERSFVGVYRERNKPNQRLPIHLENGKHVDILGNEVDLNRLVRVD